jgi:hypothetical protein
MSHNVAQARGPKIRPNLGVSCRRLCVCVFRLQSIANLLQKTSLQSIATHRDIMRVCVSFVVYCKPFTKDERSIDSNASRYHACVCVSFVQKTSLQSIATSPRNPRFQIYRECIQTTFPVRMSIFKSGISGSDSNASLYHACVCVFLL